MTLTEAIACVLVIMVGLGSALVILAGFIVRRDNAINPWFCPVCGEDYPCAVHGREVE